jgi:hypothetical protein
MPHENSNVSSKKSYTKFYDRKRQYFDEMMFARNLHPNAKILGMAIAQVASRRADDEETIAGRPADSTFTNLATFAERLGIEPRGIRGAAERLQEEGRLKTVSRNGRTHLIFALRHDAPIRSTKLGSKASYRNRGEWIEQVLFDTNLSPGHRVVALAIGAFSGNHGVNTAAVNR